jgi:hypothetical protein
MNTSEANTSIENRRQRLRAFRGQPGLKKLQERAGTNYGVDAADIAAALVIAGEQSAAPSEPTAKTGQAAHVP